MMRGGDGGMVVDTRRGTPCREAVPCADKRPGAQMNATVHEALHVSMLACMCPRACGPTGDMLRHGGAAAAAAPPMHRVVRQNARRNESLHRAGMQSSGRIRAAQYQQDGCCTRSESLQLMHETGTPCLQQAHVQTLPSEL